jgi:hypothetical protein
LPQTLHQQTAAERGNDEDNDVGGNAHKIPSSGLK